MDRDPQGVLFLTLKCNCIDFCAYFGPREAITSSQPTFWPHVCVQTLIQSRLVLDTAAGVSSYIYYSMFLRYYFGDLSLKFITTGKPFFVRKY